MVINLRDISVGCCIRVVASAEGRSQKRQGFLTAEDRERFGGAISSFSICFRILTAVGPRKLVKFELHYLNLDVLLFLHQLVNLMVKVKKPKTFFSSLKAACYKVIT